MRKVEKTQEKPRKKPRKEESEEDILRGMVEDGLVDDDKTYAVSGELLKELLSIREG